MLNEKRKIKISRLLSLLLRHQPDAIGLTLDDNGWADVKELIAKSSDAGKSFTFAELEEIVTTNDKKRFAFNDRKTKIRANQGHSIEVEIEFEEKLPPNVLFHGTVEKNLGFIFQDGLKKMKRHHVHLSSSIDTARAVGARYGKPVILEIDAAQMIAEGFKFYISANEVWLTEAVPPKFIKVL